MASLASPQPTAVNPTSPVPLDTIPISPEGGVAGAVPDSAAVSVFNDPDNFNVKHPLMNSWTLWFTKPPTGKGDNWNELLKEVISFDSVEEFWGIYNNITSASELAQKSDYHLFKKGVRPEWEDPQNKHGGKWAYQFKNKSAVKIDALWLHVMLAGIGETLEDEGDNEVMGVVVNVRKGFYRVGLWTRTTGTPDRKAAKENGGAAGASQNRQEILLKVGRRFKETLGIDKDDVVEFSGHADAAHSGSTRAKSKFQV